MTHAWLVIAHNEFDILQRLVSALDAPNSVFYIHIDRKIKHLPIVRAESGQVHFLEDRVDVRWGSVSQIRCEFTLLEAAFNHGPYDFYHIISGTTLPLRPFKEIEGFFERTLGKCLLSGLCQSSSYQETIKVHRINLFLRHYAYGPTLVKKTSQFLWKAAIALQRILGIKINRGKVFYKASNWLSLTEEAVQYLLQRKTEILKTYRYTFCGDEYFVPSELMASPLKDTLLNDEHYLLHNISRSNADTYRLDEYEKLSKTGYLFARKFTEK